MMSSAIDVLKQEMAKKRKQLESLDLDPKKKFFRRGDLVAKEEEAYWKRQNEKRPKKDEKEEDTLAERTEEILEGTSGQCQLSTEEITRRLRERNEPIRLFGESDAEAFRRLQRLEIDAPEICKGLRNDLKAAMDKVDEEYLNEVFGQTDGKHDIEIEDEDITIEKIMDMSVDLGKGDVKKDCDIIFMFFQNLLLTKWAKELNARPEEEKRSPAGKMAKATYRQTQEYLKPLFRKLKNATIQADIREHLVNIVNHMLDRDYILANNAYMEMAIGNAPWPVGVTASGIHKRPGSEKFYVRNVAHVLNDETQRKYIQALKRLMTKCQQFFKTDPSKCVEFGYNPLPISTTSD